jgi:lipid-binding SYLF domain-containing protein
LATPFAHKEITMHCLRILPLALGVWLAVGLTAPWAVAGPEDATVQLARATLDEIMSVPARAIPEALLHDAQGVAILPGVVKVGFILGGRRGRGVLLVRNDKDGWSDPVFIVITGGSIGWQAGVQATDVVLVFKTRRGIDGLLNGRRFTLGADVGIAAGPVGRQAEAATDAQLSAEIYSYSRSRGLFAGAALDGSLLEIDWPAIAGFYGNRQLTPAEILGGKVRETPAAAAELKAALTKYTQGDEAEPPLVEIR